MQPPERMLGAVQWDCLEVIDGGGENPVVE